MAPPWTLTLADVPDWLGQVGDSLAETANTIAEEAGPVVRDIAQGTEDLARGAQEEYLELRRDLEDTLQETFGADQAADLAVEFNDAAAALGAASAIVSQLPFGFWGKVAAGGLGVASGAAWYVADRFQAVANRNAGG